jgi:hypothetical protein
MKGGYSEFLNTNESMMPLLREPTEAIIKLFKQFFSRVMLMIQVLAIEKKL